MQLFILKRYCYEHHKKQNDIQGVARRVDAHGSLAHCKDAELTLDTDLSGRQDAFNPAELLLAALGACVIKSIQRVTPILKFELRGVEIRLPPVSG